MVMVIDTIVPGKASASRNATGLSPANGTTNFNEIEIPAESNLIFQLFHLPTPKASHAFICVSEIPLPIHLFIYGVFNYSSQYPL
jgi:hypothetical protein